MLQTPKNTAKRVAMEYPNTPPIDGIALTIYPHKTLEKKRLGDPFSIAPNPCAIIDIKTSSLVSHRGKNEKHNAETIKSENKQERASFCFSNFE